MRAAAAAARQQRDKNNDELEMGWNDFASSGFTPYHVQHIESRHTFCSVNMEQKKLQKLTFEYYRNMDRFVIGSR